MPIVRIKSNLDLNSDVKIRTMDSIVSTISREMKKPPSDVMVIFSSRDLVLMNGTTDLAVFIDVTFISGLNLENAKIICNELYALFNQTVVIHPSRMYINFIKADKEHAWRFVNGNAVCPASGNE